mgnify:CR=1 FL=1
MSAKNTKQSKSVSSTLERELNKLFSTEQVAQIMTLVSSSEKRRRTKAVKDPNAPKRWSSNYILFCQERRKQIVSEFPDAKATDVTAKLGQAWTALPDGEKRKYTEMSERDKERFNREMEAYNAGLGATNTSTATAETKTASSRRTKTEKKTEVSQPVQSTKTEKSNAEKSTKTKSSRATKEKESAVETKMKAPTKKGSQSTPGFKNFSTETREEVESENPQLSKKKVDEELLSRWNALEEDERQMYEDLAGEEEEEF